MMHAATRCLITAALSLMLSSLAVAQLPVATGRQIAMSRPQWKLFVPSDYNHEGDGVDLLVHFHGDPQTVWNNVAHAELNVAVVTVNYSGLSSAYSTPFGDATLFRQLLDDARAKLAAQPDFGPATEWDQLAVSSFSAGYGAVRRLLASPDYFDAIDSLLAADSLYASTAPDGTPLDSQMANYKAFASQAAAGDKRFIFTHSEVPTFTYESTAETGDELLGHLGLTPEATQERGLGPLRYYRKAEQGGFKLWGAKGADGESHLNHLRYLGEWLDDLGFGAAQLPGDYNGDGTVDAADYTIWRDNWLQFNVPGDGDGDTFVGNTDYGVWATHFGERLTTPAAAVPAPASAACVTVAFVQLATISRWVKRADGASRG